MSNETQVPLPLPSTEGELPFETTTPSEDTEAEPSKGGGPTKS